MTVATNKGKMITVEEAIRRDEQAKRVFSLVAVARMAEDPSAIPMLLSYWLCEDGESEVEYIFRCAKDAWPQVVDVINSGVQEREDFDCTYFYDLWLEVEQALRAEQPLLVVVPSVCPSGDHDLFGLAKLSGDVLRDTVEGAIILANKLEEARALPDGVSVRSKIEELLQDVIAFQEPVVTSPWDAETY